MKALVLCFAASIPLAVIAACASEPARQPVSATTVDAPTRAEPSTPSAEPSFTPDANPMPGDDDVDPE